MQPLSQRFADRPFALLKRVGRFDGVAVENWVMAGNLRRAAGFTALACVIFSLAACTAPAVPGAAATPSAAKLAEPGWIAQARKIGMDVPQNLLGVLHDEVTRNGYDGAIAVCRDKAPEMARAASERTGWNVRRVSVNNRNPKAVPDAWERAALEDFERRAALKEPAQKLERAETVIESGIPVQRYIRALPVVDLCTNCHGKPDRLKASTAAKIKEHYPQDKATGYSPGDLRGAITLKRPAP